jgi:excisionase family DNA binding protein
MQPGKDRVSFNIEEAVAVTGLNKNALYRAIAANELQTFKVGKRRMVSARALQDYIARKEEEAQRSIAA